MFGIASWLRSRWGSSEPVSERSPGEIAQSADNNPISSVEDTPVSTSSDGQEWADITVDDEPVASVFIDENIATVSVYDPKAPEDAAETFMFDRANGDGGEN